MQVERLLGRRWKTFPTRRWLLKTQPTLGRTPQRKLLPYFLINLELQQLKKRFPHLKIIASVGGWTYAKAMHSFMHTDENREKMAKSCVDLIN